jgi:CDGSH-type Zn-finger protein
MSDPVIAQEFPYFEDVVEGKTYMWCACGKSQKQPYCDGSHNGTTFEPQKYVADKTGRVMMCGCKRSKKGAICDGTHNNL